MLSSKYITTPIYYVNDEPHIGHAYTTILADTITRYNRLRDPECYFLTGTDEHGQKVQQAAEKRGVTPLAHCDEYMARFKNLWQELNISNDDFIRTTEPRHTVIVRKLLQDLYDRGDIYRAQYDGLYSVSEERFITQKEYDEGGFRDVRTISETNYFFRMSKYRDPLVEHIKSHPEFIQPENRKNEILGFLANDLGDLCISRPKSRLSWGVELPFDEDYVTYVWFDALTNYISAIGYGSADDSLYRRLWPGTHLIGKDILTTHSVYWPTMLMAAGLPLPRTIFAHGWWMSEGQKMSKSLGNFIDLKTIRSHIQAVGVDAFKYFLVKEGPLFGDSDFSRQRFYQTYNTDLANDLGNLVNRIFTLIHKYFQGTVPEPGTLGESETALKNEAEALSQKIFTLLDHTNPGQVLHEIISYVRSINKYMEEQAPWKLAKSDLPAAGRVLYASLASLRLAASLFMPVLPEKMGNFFTLLGEDASQLRLTAWEKLRPGTNLKKAEALFPRFDMTSLEQDTPAPAENKKPEETPADLIGIDGFKSVDMRVADILRAERVPKSDKLLRLSVEVGDEERTVVAGIGKWYDPDSLVGKQIIMVYNLTPVTLFGIESRGMLLTAQKDGKLVLIGPQGDIPSGAVIK